MWHRSLSKDGASRRERAQGDSLLAEFFEVQCWVNSVREAVATARETVSGFVQSGEFTDNAEIQARDGVVAKAEQAIVTAVETAETISDSSERALAFTEAAEAQFDTIAR